MTGNGRIDKVAPKPLQRSQSANLVRAHQPTVADDVGGEDRRQSAFDTLRFQRCSLCLQA
jgi:hypothetical protein